MSGNWMSGYSKYSGNECKFSLKCSRQQMKLLCFSSWIWSFYFVVGVCFFFNKQVVNDAMYIVSFPFLWLCLDLPIVNDIHKKTIQTNNQINRIDNDTSSVVRWIKADVNQPCFLLSLSLSSPFLFRCSILSDDYVVWSTTHMENTHRKWHCGPLRSKQVRNEHNITLCAHRTNVTIESYRLTASVDVWGNDNFGHFYLNIDSMP